MLMEAPKSALSVEGNRAHNDKIEFVKPYVMVSARWRDSADTPM
jgi:hypothetical protein